MSSRFLYPSDSFLVRDRGGAMPRNGPLHDRLGLTDANDSREVRRTFTPEANQHTQSSSLIGRKRLPYLNSLADTATKHTAERMSYVTEEEPSTPAAQAERRMKASASRRERCRINQARYRQRQRQHTQDLDTSINSLREEVQALETQRQNILRHVPANESVWVVATEYFRLFRNGFMAPMTAPEQSTSPITSSARGGEHNASWLLKQSNAQLDFLKATMVSDVTDGNISGPNAILRQWWLFSLYLDDVHLQVKRMEQIDDVSLLVSSTVSFTITENTLRHVFPILNTGTQAPLAAKLLNQRLVVRGSTRFDWDETRSRVVRLESKFDLLSTMLHLLGSLEAVAILFENGRVTPEGKFIGVACN